MANWSDLAVDILREIVLKLDSAQDLVYFSVVCESWQFAYSTAKSNWTRTMPWLMLPENAQNSPNYPRITYCPNKQRCYQLHLPQTYGARCWGSSCGWVVVLDPNLELYMLNPITKSRICLPPLSPMLNVSVKDEDGPAFYHTLIIEKAVVIEADEKYIVITTPGSFYRGVKYATPGDRKWTEIYFPDTNKRYVSDVTRWGSNLLFINDFGRVGYCEISTLLSSQPVTLMEYIPQPSFLSDYIVPLSFNCKALNQVYLLESFGELLMVFRYKIELYDDDPWECQTINFKVYKFNFETKIWAQVNDLGDVAIIVGSNTSLSIRASRIHNCRRNCIYFSNDQWLFRNGNPLIFGGDKADNGLFDITNQALETVYRSHENRSKLSSPFWFMPKF